MKYSPDHLTSLLTTDREKLTRICAEVCYGWEEATVARYNWDRHGYDSVSIFVDNSGNRFEGFQPLSNTEKGRSQAFELAVKFDCFPIKGASGYWIVEKGFSPLSTDKDPLAAIVIASILTAQQENNDE